MNAHTPPAFGAYGLQAAPLKPNRFAGLIEDIRVRGYGVLPAVLPAVEVEALNAAMDDIYAGQCDEVGGAAALSAINDADIARCALAYDERFLALATHPVMLEVARALLGPNVVLLMQNGVINRPDEAQFQANWHRDLNYQHWVNSRPIAMSVLVCLEDFNPETGGTVFLPGSHLAEDFPTKAEVQAGEVTPVLPRGSMILFDSMVFHRAGFNRSGRIRRAVNHVIGAPILAQQVDIPAMLNRPAPADPALAAYLGYRWNPVPDVAAWRRRKIKALG
jgi:ectoine hydroxylase-related dioxygenase (phytanoyl-CoA dioxygenase family)